MFAASEKILENEDENIHPQPDILQEKMPIDRLLGLVHVAKS